MNTTFDCTVRDPEREASNALCRMLVPAADVRQSAREFLSVQAAAADEKITALPASAHWGALTARRMEMQARIDVAGKTADTSRRAHEAALRRGDSDACDRATKALRIAESDVAAARDELAVIGKLLAEATSAIEAASRTIHAAARREAAAIARSLLDDARAELLSLLRENEAIRAACESLALADLVLFLDADVVHGRGMSLLDRLAQAENAATPRPPRTKPEPVGANA